MNIKKSDIENDVRLVEVDGEIDASTAPELEQALRLSLEEGKKRLLLDLTRMSYMSSAGLRVLIRIYQDAKKVDAEVCIAGLNPRIKAVFEVSGLLQVLKTCDTRQDALEGWSI
jgi:anti-anti-sigma factor